MVHCYDGQSKTIDELAERLNVSRQSVIQFACRLGLSKRRPTWTAEQEDFLEKHYHLMSVEDIAAKTNHSPRNVSFHAHKLGLSKFEEGYTVESLCEALGCSRPKVKKWMECGWLKGKPRQTKRTPDVWFFSASAVRNLIRWHPEEINPRFLDSERWRWLVDLLIGGDYSGIGSLANYDTNEDKQLKKQGRKRDQA